jgi:uncharacterized protein YndB with AHSA1/START domain
MVDFTIETEIARPPSEAFAFVTDPTKLALWQTDKVSCVPEPDGPLGLGSRMREVTRAPGGKKVVSPVEVAEYEPDRVFGMRMIEGPPIHGRVTFDPSERGTRLQFRIYGEPKGVMRLVEPILKPIIKRNFARYCANLKRVLEEPPPRS